MLGRARGAFGVFRMLINRAAVANWVFICWGGGWIIRQILSWLRFKRDYNATIWGIIAVVLGKQSKTTADGIGRVFADLLSNWCQRIIHHRNEIVGVEVAMRIDIWWNETLHLLELVGTTNTAVWNVLHVSIWSFDCDFVSFGGVKSICDEEPVMLYAGWRRSLEIKRLHSYGIGEERGR